MSRKNRLNLPTTLKDKFTDLLGGKTPTTDRLLKLLERKEPLMLDKTDIETGRTPYTPRDHAETIAQTSPVTIDVDDALAGVADAQASRAAGAKDRVADRIAEHAGRGLDPNRPPEDPIAAALAEESDYHFSVAPAILAPEDLVVAKVIEDRRRLSGTPDRPPDAPDAEIAKMKSAGMAQVRALADTMERQVLQRMPQIKAGGSRLRSLEEAAEILIAELQPGSIDAIRQVCAENTLEPWVVILGAVERMAVLQELHAGEFDPEWTNRAPGGSRPVSVKEQKCQMCGGVLPADARRGQAFCCSRHGSEQTVHSEGCALAHLEMRQGRWVDTRATQRA